jgi:hypothetical protein
LGKSKKLLGVPKKISKFLGVHKPSQTLGRAKKKKKKKFVKDQTNSINIGWKLTVSFVIFPFHQGET